VKRKLELAVGDARVLKLQRRDEIDLELTSCRLTLADLPSYQEIYPAQAVIDDKSLDLKRLELEHEYKMRQLELEHQLKQGSLEVEKVQEITKQMAIQLEMQRLREPCVANYREPLSKDTIPEADLLATFLREKVRPQLNAKMCAECTWYAFRAFCFEFSAQPNKTTPMDQTDFYKELSKLYGEKRKAKADKHVIEKRVWRNVALLSSDVPCATKN